MCIVQTKRRKRFQITQEGQKHLYSKIRLIYEMKMFVMRVCKIIVLDVRGLVFLSYISDCRFSSCAFFLYEENYLMYWKYGITSLWIPMIANKSIP